MIANSKSNVSQTISVNDVELNFEVQGNGPPLFLLHGGMESRLSFEKQISEFSNSFTVVALDSRGQGQSGQSNKRITYELMSEDVVALAGHLGYDRFSVLGLSDGAITALTIAMKHPNLIDKMILHGASYHFDSYPDEMLEFIKKYEWDGSTDPGGFPGIFIKHYLTGHDDLSDFGSLLKEMAEMWTTSPTYTPADLQTVKAKTLVINGDHNDTELDHVLSLYNALPNAQLFIVPDGTHYALAEKPSLMNSVILEFLNTQ